MKFLASIIHSLLLAYVACAGELGGITAPIAASTSGQPIVGNLESPSAPAASGLLEEREVLAALEKDITGQLNLDGELRLSFARAWTPVRLPAGDPAWTLTVTAVPQTGASSSMLIRFRVDVDGKLFGDWQAIVRAQLWKPVWVASKRLDRGQALDPSACTTQSVDVLREKQQMVPASTNLMAYELVQTVNQDRPILWRDITARPLVRKGQAVDVVATDGSMTISMKGMAMSNGGAGDAVIVRNPDSRKDFSAKVTGANTVQVSF